MDKDAKKKWAENSRKYNFLHFLYNATHPEPYCSSPPHQVYIEPTNVCNLRCSHCPQHTMRREKQYMSLELFEKIVKQLAEFEPFVDLYLQGEPLLHPEIVEMVRIVSSHGLLPRITTNTTMLRKKLAGDLIDAGLDKIEFSMSGASKSTYDDIYKGARFEKTLSNMINFLEINGERGFPVHTRSVFVEEEKTVKEKEKYLACFSELPLDDVYVSPLINMFGWNKELDISPFKTLPREEWPICKTPWRQMAINADGSVRSCAFDYDSRYLIGNVKDTPVLELWNSERMMAFRKGVLERRYEDLEKPGLPLCTECSQLWPTSTLADTTQMPNDFLKEVEAFFANEEAAFKAKYSDMETKQAKLAFLRAQKEFWIEKVLADLE